MRSNREPNELMVALRASDLTLTQTEESLPRLRRLARLQLAVPAGDQTHAGLLAEAQARLEQLYERRDRLLAKIALRRARTSGRAARRAADDLRTGLPG
ncbi:MAG: hypothetical protein AB7I59_02845 [Geminicoccaceae bacterium]